MAEKGRPGAGCILVRTTSLYWIGPRLNNPLANIIGISSYYRCINNCSTRADPLQETLRSPSHPFLVASTVDLIIWSCVIYYIAWKTLNLIHIYEWNAAVQWSYTPLLKSLTSHWLAGQIVVSPLLRCQFLVNITQTILKFRRINAIYVITRRP